MAVKKGATPPAMEYRDGYLVLRGRVSEKGTWVGYCPCCGWKLVHGAFDVTRGPEHAEHRVAHCDCWDGYLIAEEGNSAGQ